MRVLQGVGCQPLRRRDETGKGMTEDQISQPDLAGARSLIGNGQAEAAINMLKALPSEQAETADALYTLAVAYRFTGQTDQALSELGKMTKSFPDIGRAYQEIGYNHRDAGREADFIASLETAVKLDPALLQSWRILEAHHRAHQNSEALRLAAGQVARLSALAPALVNVSSLINEGKIFRAEDICRAHLRRYPKDVEGMRLLADIGSKLRVLDDAEMLLESALAFEPHHLPARFEYASVLKKRQKFSKALEQTRQILEKEPENPVFLGLHASVLSALGEHDEALAIYEAMSETAPAAHLVFNSSGHALKTLGRYDDAVSAYRQAYAVKPDFGDAFWSLANLKTYRFTEGERAQAIKAEQAEGTSVEDRIHLCFAMGKCHEDAEDYEQAFAFYERGNRLKHEQSRYTIERNNLETDLHIEFFDNARLDSLKGLGFDAPDPIFIVGLPRSGSTLLEQILASHSLVDGTLELPQIVTLAHKLNGPRRQKEQPEYPGVLANLKPPHFDKMGRQYIEETRIYRGEAPFFTDKMPNNFRHIGLILSILPNARIIDARRHPMGACFSGFKQLFAEGQEFSYGLAEIGNYYRRYLDVMDHWHRVLPGRILTVQYEDVVSDLEGQVQRILSYCGLPFEESCLSFYETERAVRTPSAEQVRQPIYTSGVEQWRKFEPWLDPLKSALGPVLDRYPI